MRSSLDGRGGIIPAYAGNTFRAAQGHVIRRDHPRVCGEHFGTARGGGTHRGSSPRMRGTRYPSRSCDCACGIIPAYAGNTSLPSSQKYQPRDHPRVCGEHPHRGSGVSVGAGSSPRMRGTPPPRQWRKCRRGIIPAYAGNTRNPNPRKRPPRDHPRVCGEHQSARLGLRSRPGSSPRMRGTRHSLWAARPRPRIIPAYAGNTAANRSAWNGPTDHPRVCGEHHQLRALRPGQRGIIPAYAGNTILVRRPLESGRDHPRVCGEHPPVSSCDVRAQGSSPRMRGTQHE